MNESSLYVWQYRHSPAFFVADYTKVAQSTVLRLVFFDLLYSKNTFLVDKPSSKFMCKSNYTKFHDDWWSWNIDSTTDILDEIPYYYTLWYVFAQNSKRCVYFWNL